MATSAIDSEFEDDVPNQEEIINMSNSEGLPIILVKI